MGLNTGGAQVVVFSLGIFFLILEARFGGSDKPPKRRLNDNQ